MRTFSMATAAAAAAWREESSAAVRWILLLLLMRIRKEKEINCAADIEEETSNRKGDERGCRAREEEAEERKSRTGKED